MMLYTGIAAVAFAATALAASGCGSSKATSSSNASATTASTPVTSAAPTTSAASTAEPGKALTKAELIAKADPICARANAGLFSAEIKKVRDYATVMPQDAAYLMAETTELRKLTPPASMANDWQRIVAGLQTVAVDIAKVGEYARKNTLAAATPVFAAANKRREQVLEIAKRNGFKDCSQLHK